MAIVKLKTLTLNAWGGFYSGQDRAVRMKAIANSLATKNYDIVCLQEVWDMGDYELIRKQVEPKLPESYYFHSGLIGSGVCIFTRGQITASLMHRYSLNGYLHKPLRGDWFCGKVVGLVRVKLGDLKIDVYGTHLHAEYENEKDLYLPNRVLHAFELSQFINETTTGDIALLFGDLNLTPQTTGLKLILSNASMYDAFMERMHETQPRDSHPNGFTNGVCSNCYISNDVVFLTGERTDYILFRGSANRHIECDTCYTSMGRISGNPNKNYSNHLGVCANFVIKPPKKADQKVEKEHQMLDHAIQHMESGIDAVTSKETECGVYLGVFVFLFIATIVVEVTNEQSLWTRMMMLFLRFILTLVIGYYLGQGLVGLGMEKKAFIAARNGMMLLKKTDVVQ